MDIPYDVLHRLLIQRQNEQPKEFTEIINLINSDQIDSEIYDLVNYLSQEEAQYITDSHA